MIFNVLDEYIKITKNEINDYMKLIFEKKYVKKISDKYIETYLNVKFYNFYNKDENLSFKDNFVNAIKDTKSKIIENNPKEKRIIENMAIFYSYIFDLDKIDIKRGIESEIEKIYKIRRKILSKDNEDFKQKFYNTYLKYLVQKEDFINQFDSNEFNIKSTEYKGAKNVYKVVLQHNVEIPRIYSIWAIDKTFNEGITAEDKLFVEYNMVCCEIIKDLLKGKFKKQYIVEFTPTILKKKKKLKRLLNVINNAATQDKLNLKITYTDFIKYKDEIYELMRQGFKFAVVIDNTIDSEFSTLQKLNVFNYCIISKSLHFYKEIMDNKVLLNNIIEL